MARSARRSPRRVPPTPGTGSPTRSASRRSTSPSATRRSATSRSARTSSSTRGRSPASTRRASRLPSWAGARTSASCRSWRSRTSAGPGTRSASRTQVAERGCAPGCPALTSWWYGSLLDIHESRRLAPHQNATTLQVAAALLGAVQWLLANPRRGVRLPDELPHEEVLGHARPYLGPIASRRSDWTPLLRWADSFAGFARPRPADDDVWQFSTFLVHGPA